MRGAWAHLTSWWVYPLIGALAALLVVLALLRVQEEVTLILFRLTVVAAALAYMYDHRWRRRRLSQVAKADRGKTKRPGGADRR